MVAQLTATIDTRRGKCDVVKYGIYGPSRRRPFAGGRCPPGHVQAVIETVDRGGKFHEDQDEMALVMLNESRYAHIVDFMRADGSWRWDEDTEATIERDRIIAAMRKRTSFVPYTHGVALHAFADDLEDGSIQ